MVKECKQTETEILVTQKLKISYKEQVVLKEIDVSFHKGTITALIGPSGTGKTTFLHALTRLNKSGTIVTGKILYHGIDINDQGVDVYHLRTHIGMLFQTAYVFPMSIYDNIAFSLRCHGMNEKAGINQVVEMSLIKAGLWARVKDHLKQDARLLSKSQAQQLCLARALALNPEVLLLDEATSLLDPVATNTVENSLRLLRGQTTVILATHNLAQAARVSDETLFLNEGLLVEKGKTKDIFTHPQEQTTDNYLSHNFKR
ncbi:phosphate ABC transporter ATP-binding protein [Liquorilactobacillus capillatus]|uniref:Phosphate-transporting ATPase n=1 Tax=Liquorilactobacillus capillatus DSM 19910 TaxID=1423731 RepID=A0A0R1M4C2_9LACO|nr:phosphate ABC transporter ATP-binding protein [Liquorilactobacillus capillatus]KRL02908.1 phosphate-transporting ATPase [Liquorilactobacillus capillatus DSM 19910]